MNLEAVRIDSERSIRLQPLPASWYREEYDRHAWFESASKTPTRRLADALLIQGLAVMEPKHGWLYRYEKNMPWAQIALGCDFHDGRGWNKKTSDVDPSRPVLGEYLIRY